MSFIDCIQDRVERKLIQPAQAKRLQNQYLNLKEKYTKSMGDESAAAQAASDMVAVAAEKQAQKNLNTVRTAQALKRNVEEVKERGGGKENAKKVAEEKILRVHNRRESVEKQLFVGLDEFIFQFRSKKAGFSIDDMSGVVREVLEPGSTNADESTRAMAKALSATYSTARERLKASGAVIGKIDNYFPVSHNRHRLRKIVRAHDNDMEAAFNQWSASLLPKLDRDKMIDWDTGLPFSDKRLIEAMRQDFDDIVSNGATKIEREALEAKAMIGKAGGPARRYEANKFYIFKSADDFLAYNEEFGEGTEGLFDIFTGSISGLSRDIAILEEFGPNPQAVFNNLKGLTGLSPQSRTMLDGMFDDIMGRSSVVPEGNQAFYDGMATFHNLLKTALLGSAPLAAVNDLTFLSVVARMNDMPVFGTMNTYLKLIAQDPQAKQIARDVGFFSDYAVGKIMSGERMSGELAPGGGAQILASSVNRLSGLNSMTIAAKEAISIQFASMLARNRNLKFSELPDMLQTMMGDNGRFYVS